MKHPCQVLVRKICDAVCDEAEKIERFSKTKQGCLRLTFYPQHAVANAWLGGFPFSMDYIPDLEITYPILPKGTRIAVFNEENPETGEKEDVVVDTYTITAAKIAAVSYVQDDGTMLSGVKDLKEFVMENGFAPWMGAIATEVYERSSDKLIPYCGLYVSVSGATEQEDFICAKAAIPIIQRFFADEGFICKLPSVEPKLLEKLKAQET